MGIKVSLLVLILVVSFSCGCVQESSQNISNQPEAAHSSPESTQSPSSIELPSKDLENSSQKNTHNTTWQTESDSSQKELGWSPPPDKERKDQEMSRTPNGTRVSTIKDFKVTRINAE